MTDLHWRSQTVIVTGGRGFLGQHVVRELLRLGALVFAPPSCEFDLRTEAGARALLDFANSRTILVHLAATVGGIGANQARPADFYTDNTLMNTLIARECARRGIRKLIAIGSVCGYPKRIPVPFREADIWSGYPEETNAPYGVSKRGLLVQLEAERAQYGLASAYLMLTNLYGPGDNFDPATSHVIPALIRRFVAARQADAPSVTIWGSGQVTRDFLFVADAVNAIRLAIERLETPEPINVGSGCETLIADLADQIASLVGYRGRIEWDRTKPDGQPRRWLDSERAAIALGWRPTISLEAGLRMTIDYYLGFQDA